MHQQEKILKVKTVHESEEEIEGNGVIKFKANNLVEGLELLVLETKTVQDGLDEEILNISKQLFPLNLTCHEQQVSICVEL